VTRESATLGDPPGRLDGFPPWRLRRERTIHRAHPVSNGPWWFGSSMDGRFDLPDPNGTCYLASSVQASVRERLGPELVRFGAISSAEADQFRVSALHVPHGHRLADTSHREAARHHLTRELVTHTPYDLPQRWAAAFHACGFAGIRYLARFSTGSNEHAYALFGEHGAQDWPADPDPLSGRDAAAKAGITVVDLPRRNVLRVVQPPGP
jgi:hypothetical protein